MNPGKSIRIFLVDGAPTGTLTAEIMNWTGKVDVLKRLARHEYEGKLDFWQRTVFVVSKDENLTKAHARYLESRLIQLANEANRARVMNGTAPPTPSLPEADVADMEYFLDQVVMMMPVLGFGFLQPSPRIEPAQIVAPESPLFRLTAAGVRAEARVINGQFVVLKGALARKQGVESWTSYRGQREELLQSGRLVDGSDPQYLVFADNVPFDSPSAAAAVVLGRNSNGRIEWKVADTGRTYADWQEAQLKLAGVDPTAEVD